MIFDYPHYSVFSRRAKKLSIPLREFLKPGENLHIIFDSTGLKVFGEGEWKTRKHGYSKKRTWRKLHVGMCADSETDAAAMVEMMGGLDDASLGDVFGDGAYDTIDCRMAIHDRGGRQVIPPPKNAHLSNKDPHSLSNRTEYSCGENQKRGKDGRKLWKHGVVAIFRIVNPYREIHDFVDLLKPPKRCNFQRIYSFESIEL